MKSKISIALHRQYIIYTRFLGASWSVIETSVDLFFSLVHFLLDEIVGSTVHRCLDAVLMETSVSESMVYRLDCLYSRLHLESTCVHPPPPDPKQIPPNICPKVKQILSSNYERRFSELAIDPQVYNKVMAWPDSVTSTANMDGLICKSHQVLNVIDGENELHPGCECEMVDEEDSDVTTPLLTHTVTTPNYPQRLFTPVIDIDHHIDDIDHLSEPDTFVSPGLLPMPKPRAKAVQFWSRADTRPDEVKVVARKPAKPLLSNIILNRCSRSRKVIEIRDLTVVSDDECGYSDDSFDMCSAVHSDIYMSQSYDLHTLRKLRAITCTIM